jgi:transposase
MKRDGRTLDHGTLETIRLMAVERVRDGEAPSAVIAAYGFSRTTIYRWLRAVAKPGVGLRALRARPATGRPRSLTSRQEWQVFRWINGRDPRQYGLDFGLWTRSVVADLIERKFGIRLGLTAVGGLLAVTMNIGPLVLANFGPPSVSLTCWAGPRPGSAGRRHFVLLPLMVWRPCAAPRSGGTDRSRRRW